MSIESKIEWTEASWSPVVGCSKWSEGCNNCYAINHAWRLGHNPNEKINSIYNGLVKKNADGSLNWTGETRTIETRLNWPLTVKTPKRIFVNPMADLFHRSVSPIFIEKVFEVMRQAHWHTFQILTKREVLMWARVNGIYNNWLYEGKSSFLHLRNVWLGVSVENQEAAARIDMLQQTPSAVRFISCEPLLEAIDLRPWLKEGGINLVIVGGESGHKARPMNEDWVRFLRDQCLENGVKFFYKQRLEGRKKISLPLLDGSPYAEMPEAK